MSDVQQQPKKNRLGGATGKGFMPGQSGNPGGRKKGTSITAILNRKLDELGDDGRSRAEKIAEVIVREAEAGDYKFVDMLLQRTEGKIPDKVLNVTAAEAKQMSDEELEELVSGSGGR
jgi:hypothetical protein